MATIGDGRPDNSLADMTSLTKAYAAARAAKQAAAPAPPALSGALPPPAPTPPPASPGPVSMLGQNMFNPVPPPSNPGLPAWAQMGVMPKPAQPMPPTPQASPVAPAPSVPMPMARPADAPQAPAPMGFFARNTAMMRDPSTGDFLDPAAAQKADATGPDVIQKMMNYFHNKDVA